MNKESTQLHIDRLAQNALIEKHKRIQKMIRYKVLESQNLEAFNSLQIQINTILHG